MKQYRQDLTLQLEDDYGVTHELNVSTTSTTVMAIPMPNADMVANMATYHKKNSLTLISVAIHESVTVELMMPD